MLARLLHAWEKLDKKQRTRITKLAEQVAGTAHKPHDSKLPAVVPGEGRMIPAVEAAATLGIAVETLRDWTKRGWITGAEKIGGRNYYPPEAVAAAERRKQKRKTKGVSKDNKA